MPATILRWHRDLGALPLDRSQARPAAHRRHPDLVLRLARENPPGATRGSSANFTTSAFACLQVRSSGSGVEGTRSGAAPERPEVVDVSCERRRSMMLALRRHPRDADTGSRAERERVRRTRRPDRPPRASRLDPHPRSVSPANRAEEYVKHSTGAASPGALDRSQPESARRARSRTGPVFRQPLLGGLVKTNTNAAPHHATQDTLFSIRTPKRGNPDSDCRANGAVTGIQANQVRFVPHALSGFLRPAHESDSHVPKNAKSVPKPPHNPGPSSFLPARRGPGAGGGD